MSIRCLHKIGVLDTVCACGIFLCRIQPAEGAEALLTPQNCYWRLQRFMLIIAKEPIREQSPQCHMLTPIALKVTGSKPHFM